MGRARGRRFGASPRATGSFPPARTLEEEVLPGVDDIVGCGHRRARLMLEIVLTREDANSESAFLVRVERRRRRAVRKGSVVCVVETSKASIEIEAPGDGILVQLVPRRRPRSSSAARSRLVAADADGGCCRPPSGSRAAAESPRRAGPANVTKRAAELAAQHGIDLGALESRASSPPRTSRR